MRQSRSKLPFFMKLINASAVPLGAMGLDVARLNVASVHEAATKRTGLTDFGAPYYLEGLERLIESACCEARLYASGRLFLREMIVKYLANRLMLCEVRKRVPEIFARPLVPPLIVIGLPRSGTSALHRALAADPAHRAIPYWELMNPFTRTGVGPATDVPKLIREIEWRLAVRSQVTPEADRQHYLRADSPEECSFALGLTFTSLVFWMLAPVFEYLGWYLRQDRMQAYREYRDLLQIAQAASDRRLVLKAPEHMSALGALLAAVPEAMIVQTHRDPAEVCLSLDSMLFSNHGALAGRVDAPRLAETNATLVERLIERCITDRRAYPSAVHDVLYTRLVDDPLGAARSVYERFGLPWTPEVEAGLGAHLADNQQGKHGWHRYRAADFGQSEAELRRRFDGYFERNGLRGGRRVGRAA